MSQPVSIECAGVEGNVEISVIVCTYNHANSLRRTLWGLVQMEVPQTLLWELVVVDNNSHDETRQIVKELRSKTATNVRYTFERQQGLSCARNRGILEASGKVVAFTDDDVIVSRTWLAEIWQELNRSEGVDMICGRTKPYRDDQFRLAVKDEDARELFVHPTQPFTVGLGNNMIIRKSLINRVGLFDADLGAGTQIGAAEDTDYIYRVLRSNNSILYAPQIVVYHDHDRTTEGKVSNIENNYQRSRGALYCKYILRGDFWALKWFYWDQIDLWKDVFGSRNQRKMANLNFVGAFFEGCVLRVMVDLKGVLQKAGVSAQKVIHAGRQ